MMGRWAQRSHRGGGAGEAPSLNFMTLAAVLDPTDLDVTYHDAVDATDLAAADFHTQPLARDPIDIIQNGANKITLSFDDDISLETAISYTGAAVGFVTPQTLAY